MIIGLILYIVGNILIVGQSYVGHNEKVRSGKHVNLIVTMLFVAMGLGVVLTIAGLIFVFMAHWWLALTLLFIGEPLFAKRMVG